MAEFICRTLRDGSLEGEQSPALFINDTINCSVGGFVFDHVLSQLSSFISSQKFPAKGIVLVAFSRSPLYYEHLLKRKGFGIAGSRIWFKVLDCYTDPMRWKIKLAESGRIKNIPLGTSLSVNVCNNVKDLDELLLTILKLGREMSGDGKERILVAIDSVNDMLRHASIISVASFINELRNQDQISSLFWLAHVDLMESRVYCALEYASSMKATIEPTVPSIDDHPENLCLMEQNSRRGKFFVRVKRRNGRVKAMVEDIFIENSGVRFSPVASEDVITVQRLVPKVQFNLGLSEKEKSEKAKVILPFEHQGGNGKTIEIYGGRNSANENGGGEITYFRDSDDEMPDSDEDPDDDLDI